MATRKIKDLAIVVGSYKDPQSGLDKNRYKTIGHVLQKDDGGTFMLLDPFVNLAAAPRGQGKDMVMVSMFDVNDSDQNQSQAQSQAPAPGYDTHYYAQAPMPQDAQQWTHPDGRPMSPAEVQAYQQQMAQGAQRR